MTTQDTKEDLTIRDHWGDPVDCRIDVDGDLVMEFETDDGDKCIFIKKDDLPRLRDWLIKVLS